MKSKKKYSRYIVTRNMLGGARRPKRCPKGKRKKCVKGGEIRSIGYYGDCTERDVHDAARMKLIDRHFKEFEKILDKEIDKCGQYQEKKYESDTGEWVGGAKCPKGTRKKCVPTKRTIYIGPRGGEYYVTPGGKKVYI